MSFTNTFEVELVGLDKPNTVNAYYARDLAMNLNNSNIIVNYLRKLGYYNINFNTEEETYIKGKIITWIKTSSYSNLLNTNLSNLVSEIRSSRDFALFSDRLNLRLERSAQLSHFINTNDTYDFYSGLTLEELNTLGY
jgi:hypothetical protein